MKMAAWHRRATALSSHLSQATASTAAAEVKAVEVTDSEGVLGWPALGLPAPEYRHAPRLEAGSPAVNAHLEEHGFAVVKGALSPEEVEQAMENVWSLIESQGTGVVRDDPRTWTNNKWSPRTAAQPEQVAGTGAGAGGHGMLQSDCLWYIRSRPGLRKMWEGIYKTDDLIVSFDGLNVILKS